MLGKRSGGVGNVAALTMLIILMLKSYSALKSFQVFTIPLQEGELCARQRLGLESYASDLNPVAVLINKAMIEIPPKFTGQPPVNPEARTNKQLIAKQWKGAQGLADDVRHYGLWMREEAEKRIGHLYPKVLITPEITKKRRDLIQYKPKAICCCMDMGGTIPSPNPIFSSKCSASFKLLPMPNEGQGGLHCAHDKQYWL